jgi:hypothetical protein
MASKEGTVVSITKPEMMAAIEMGKSDDWITNEEGDEQQVEIFESNVAADAVIKLFAEKLQIHQKQQIMAHCFRKPFHYDDYGQNIFDANNNHVLELRGWGHIQHLFPNEQIAGKAQDDIGRFIVDLLNLFWVEVKQEPKKNAKT